MERIDSSNTGAIGAGTTKDAPAVAAGTTSDKRPSISDKGPSIMETMEVLPQRQVEQGGGCGARSGETPPSISCFR